MWRKINLPDPTYYIPCVLNPRQPLSPFARRGVCTEPLIHDDLQPSFRSSARLPASPADNEQPPTFLPPGLQQCIASELCLPCSPALAQLPLQPPKLGINALCQCPFTLSSRLMIKKTWGKAKLSPKPAWNLLFGDESSLTTTFWDLSVIQLSICLTYPLVHTILRYFLSRMSWF